MAHSFTRSFWGYRCTDVDEFIAGLAEKHKAGIESVEKHKESLEEANRQLKEELEAIKTETVRYEQMEKAISDALIQSQVKSLRIIEEAKTQIEEMKLAAEEEVSASKLELHNLRSKISQLRSEFEQLLRKYKSFLDDVTDLENKAGLEDDPDSETVAN